MQPIGRLVFEDDDEIAAFGQILAQPAEDLVFEAFDVDLGNVWGACLERTDGTFLAGEVGEPARDGGTQRPQARDELGSVPGLASRQSRPGSVRWHAP